MSDKYGQDLPMNNVSVGIRAYLKRIGVEEVPPIPGLQEFVDSTRAIEIGQQPIDVTPVAAGGDAK